tara:strand:+ start:1558 stop:3588 length:2031 start_codon:yes stop_codon:yes gene_type:complete
MSLNAVLTADRTQFKNYFSEGITLPAQANVALTKLSLEVPVFMQTSLYVPLIANADRTDNALLVTIDGIEKEITWRDLYNAFVDYPNFADPSLAEQDMTEDAFFSGTYPFFINNNLYLSDDGNNFASKCPPMYMLARALQEKYQFYKLNNVSTYTDSYSGVPDNQSLNAAYAGGTVNYTNSYVRGSTPNKYKINASYNPVARTGATFTESTFPGSDMLTGTWSYPANVLTSAAISVNVAYNNSADIDLNGGYQRVSPNLATGGRTAWGYSLVGRGNGTTDKHLPRTYANLADATPIIDIGIQFESITEGADTYLVYKIIDGQHINYDGTSVKVASNYKPYDAVSRFENGDRFAIVCRRGNILDDGYQYVFDIKQGDGTDVTTYKTVYTSTKTLNNASIQMVPVFLSNAVAGNTFGGINFVATGADTLSQGNSIFRDGGAFLDTFKIGISDSVDNDKSDYRDFFNGLGLNYRISGGQLDPLGNGFFIEYDGDATNKTISWDPVTKSESGSGYLDTSYWIGETRLNNIFRYDSVNTWWEVDPTLSLANMPKYLDVYLLNHTNKNYSGSFISTASFLGGSNEGEDRMVGSVPVVEEITESQILELNYETFNPYYRPIGNPNAYITNEFIIEVSYKDHRTNLKKFISQILGTLRLELNFNKSNRQNVNRITAVNELVPLI